MKNEEYKELLKKYHDLEIKYINDKYAIIDEKKIELEALKDQYKIDRLSIEQPLKQRNIVLKLKRKKEIED